MKNKEKGFTLSEVIITLVVLGIVAAITVPMLSNSAHDKKWNVARQKAKATIGEAFRLMTVNGEITTTNSDNTPRTTEYMVTKVLPKYLKLEKTCAPANYSQCGFPGNVKAASYGDVSIAPNNYKWSTITNAMVWDSSRSDGVYDTNRIKSFTAKYGQTYNVNYFFRTLDGFSVAFLYNPYCVSNSKERYTAFYGTNPIMYVQQIMDMICLMGIYDMNGKKGPNTVGRDIGFIGSFYNGFETTTAAVLPDGHAVGFSEPYLKGKNVRDKLNNYCNNSGKDKEWIMPDIYELSLIYLNGILAKNQTNDDRFYVSRSIAPADGFYRNVNFNYGFTTYGEAEYSSSSGTKGPLVRCVRRTQLR